VARREASGVGVRGRKRRSIAADLAGLRVRSDREAHRPCSSQMLCDLESVARRR
jgi:hypothetical protein